jgi:hypothetical protein
MRDGVRKSLARAAFETPVITWILPEENREGKRVKKVAGHIVCKGRDIALPVAGHALAKGGIVILSLGYGGIESGANECDRFEGVAHKQIELVRRIKSAEFPVCPAKWRVNSLDLKLAGEIGNRFIERPFVIVSRK